MWGFSEDKSWTYLEDQFDWVKRMSQVPQDSRHHAEGNVAIHTQMVLQALVLEPAFKALSNQDQEVLWTAALLHDVEKFSTTVLQPDGSITANGHARKGAQFARQLLYLNELAPFTIREEIVGLIRHHGFPIWLFEKPDPLKALIKVSMEVNTEWLALLARADMLGRICEDQEEMLYRIDCFEAYCQENNCLGKPYEFTSAEAKMYYLQHEDTYINYIPFEIPGFEAVMMSGLPGSGKDTYIKKHYTDWPVISLDAIRMERGISPTDKIGNGKVIQEAKELARVYLRKQQSFVWNATNITSQMRMQLIDLFSIYKASVRIIYVEVPFGILHKQNKNRENVIPTFALNRLARKLEVPATWEAHEIIYSLHL